MVWGPTGRIFWSPLYSEGIQYPEASAGALHVVAPPSREAVVLEALVEVLPMKVWSWDFPGCPG